MPGDRLVNGAGVSPEIKGPVNDRRLVAGTDGRSASTSWLPFVGHFETRRLPVRSAWLITRGLWVRVPPARLENLAIVGLHDEFFTEQIPQVVRHAGRCATSGLGQLSHGLRGGRQLRVDRSGLAPDTATGFVLGGWFGFWVSFCLVVLVVDFLAMSWSPLVSGTEQTITAKVVCAPLPRAVYAQVCSKQDRLGPTRLPLEPGLFGSIRADHSNNTKLDKAGW